MVTYTYLAILEQLKQSLVLVEPKGSELSQAGAMMCHVQYTYSAGVQTYVDVNKKALNGIIHILFAYFILFCTV